MKKWVALFALLFVFWTYDSVDAHSGRTDSSGGHNCSEKSQAKGLCSGYHYHNGGTVDSGSSSSSDSSSSSYDSTQTTESWDKDCSDFSSYEEVVSYWNANGYTKENDPEKLDGWGNVVDDGIPCEAPSGYDTSTINGSEAQIAKVEAEKAAAIAEQDKVEGEAKGYEAGLAAGSKGEERNTSTTGSDAFQEGYRSTYEGGYSEGFQQLERKKRTAQTEGYELGKKQDKVAIPSAYQAIIPLKTAFEEGFNKGVTERDEAKKKEFLAIGLKNGKEDIKQVPENIKDIYIEAYLQGYQNGLGELKQSYIKQGYDAAFKMVSYKEPALEKAKYINWYKEGFESNKEVVTIQEAAYDMGLNGEDYTLPEEYGHAEPVFSHYYKSGKEEHEKNVNTGVGVAATAIVGWFGRRFYVARTMVK